MTAPTRDEVIRMAREAGVIPSSPYLVPHDNARLGLERLVAAAYARGVADAHDAAPADHIPDAGKMVPDPVAWECTGIGLKRFLTQVQYEAQAPNVKRWYVPFRCSTCAATIPAHQIEAAQAMIEQQAAQALAANGGAK